MVKPLTRLIAKSQAFPCKWTYENLVPRYFFHIYQVDCWFEDRTGLEFSDVAAAWLHAMDEARELVEGDSLTGSIDDHRVEIKDEVGAMIATMPFNRARLH